MDRTALEKNKKLKQWISYLLLCVGIPLVIWAGVVLFEDRRYSWIMLCITILACASFFITFERGNSGTKQMILIAVMVALAVVGRMLFAMIPGFKPVTALVIVTAIYFGPQAGFMTGALTALISNFAYGQGPWTPFQMFVWGLIGLLAGLAAARLKKSRVALLVCGLLSGALFSMLMDVYGTLSMDGTFNVARYLTMVVTSAPFTAIYMASNVVFLVLFSKPIGAILQRVKTKYGI